MQRAFDGFGKMAVLCPVSDWVARRAAQSEIVRKMPIKTVYNAVDTPFFLENAEKKEKAVLHVTAHFSPKKEHPKGGWYVLALAKRMPGVTFYVAGNAEAVPQVPNNVVFLGEVTDRAALAALYRRARVTLVPSRAETFSMPCAESLCCGTPVVGFRAGGPEEITLSQYSSFVPYGDLDALEAVLRHWLAADADAVRIARAAREAYSPEKMVGQFVEVYRGLLCK